MRWTQVSLKVVLTQAISRLLTETTFPIRMVDKSRYKPSTGLIKSTYLAQSLEPPFVKPCVTQPSNLVKRNFSETWILAKRERRFMQMQASEGVKEI